MSRPTVKIHNAETNKIIEREMNDEEFHQWQIDNDTANQVFDVNNKRIALLEKLGITEEEAKLLLG